MATKNETKIIVEPGKQELFITREFEAPRELVFKAWTDGTLITQWLGPKNLTMEIDVFEPRNGGEYRYTHIAPDGSKYKFRGVYHEVVAPERTIETFEYEGWHERGHVSFETCRFEELPEGRTKLTIQSIFQSVEDRDNMVKAGMERGVREGHTRLDELLERI